jgi:glycosyltransferase family protein
VKISVLINNIKYLSKYSIKNIANNQANKGLGENNISQEALELILDSFKYEMLDEITKLKIPKIKSVDETLSCLIEKKASICRFGDGEFSLIKGKNIVFQKASPKIGMRLEEVLSSKHSNILIAIPKVIYTSKDNINDIGKNFWRINGKEYRELMGKYLDFDNQYYSAEVSLAYSMYKNYDIEDYFKRMGDIWRDRDVTVICGRTVFDRIDYNIFECAKSIEYLYVPSQDAFESYEDIIAEAKKISQDRLIVAICGPTAKILSYDLAIMGYQALDLGHVAKSYDWFKKKKATSELKDAINFFNPD